MVRAPAEKAPARKVYEEVTKRPVKKLRVALHQVIDGLKLYKLCNT